MYYFVLAVFVAVFLFIARVVHSPFGQVLKAIRENEPRAISLGYDINRYKLLAFVLSAALAGLAGSLKALVLGFATLSDVQQATSGEVILMTLLGGTGTFFGPVVGAAVDRHAAGIPVRPRRWLGDRHHRRHLRGLRAVVPPRHRRRACGCESAAAAGTGRPTSDQIVDAACGQQRALRLARRTPRSSRVRDDTARPQLPRCACASARCPIGVAPATAASAARRSSPPCALYRYAMPSSVTTWLTSSP